MFNRISHYAIGFVVGALLRRWPKAAILNAVIFGAYQIIERQAKDDAAYPEIKEFGIGVGCGLVAEAADSSVQRGSPISDFRFWRDNWVRAIRQTQRAAIPAKNKLTNQEDEDGNRN